MPKESTSRGIRSGESIKNIDPDGSIPGGYSYAESRITHTPIVYHDERNNSTGLRGEFDPKQTVAKALRDESYEFPDKYDQETLAQLQKLHQNQRGVINIYTPSTPNTVLHESAHALVHPYLGAIAATNDPYVNGLAHDFFSEKLPQGLPMSDHAKTIAGLSEAMGHNITTPSITGGYGSVINSVLDYLERSGHAGSADLYRKLVQEANYHDPDGTAARVPDYWKPTRQ